MAASVTIDPAWTLDNQNTSFNGRQVIGTFLQQAAGQATSSVLWRDGVVASVYASSLFQDLLVTQPASAGMNVRVYQGTGIITRTGQGPYVCPNSSVRVVPLDASNSTNPRIDLIVLQVTDLAIGDGSSAAVVKSVTGTPAGSPVPPATPTGAIVLAHVAVAANATTIVNADITDKRKSAGVNGAVRTMLPGDSASDAGAKPGDMRAQVVTGVSRPPEWFGADAAWHGTQVTTVAQPAQVASGSLAAGSSVRVSTITIPWPGYPYKVNPWGALLLQAGSGGNECVMQINLDNDAFLAVGGGNAPNAASLCWASVNMGSSAQEEGHLMPGYSAAITDGATHNLYFWIKNNTGANALTVAAGFSYRFLAKILPA